MQILVTPLQNREADTLVSAWKLLYTRLTSKGHVTTKYILDNEFSGALRDAIQKENLSFELVPPGQHRPNAAERAIRIFKNHFIAGLATCDPEFPLQEWDWLLPQAELSLNLLCNSRVNPALSAWAYLFGNHDFNKVSLLPPGTRVVMHSKPDKCTSWAFHGEKGWYVGPATSHYRCIKVYIPKTQRERITDTAQIISKQIPIPQASIQDHLRNTADKMVHLLSTNPSFLPYHIPTNTNQALLDIAQLLQHDTTLTIKLLLSANATAPIITSNITSTQQAMSPSSEGAPLQSTSEGVHHLHDKSIINIPNVDHLHKNLVYTLPHQHLPTIHHLLHVVAYVFPKN